MGLTALLADTNWWPFSARLAVALTKAGCRVSGICPTRGHPMLKTRVVQRVFPYSPIDSLGSLEAAIEESNPDIIIPCDDRSVLHLHQLYKRTLGQGASGKRVAALVELSLGSPASYPIISSRYELLRVAREAGVRVPETKPIGTVDDLRSWDAEQKLPWVLKADGTWGGHGVKIARDRREAEQAFVEMARPLELVRAWKRLIVNRDPFWLRPWVNGTRPAVTVQSYICGGPANRAVVCWNGKILAGTSVEVISALAETGCSTVVRVIDNPEMSMAAELVTRRLGLSGFVGFDFMIEHGSGAAYLIEMNARCTPLCHLQLGKGRDMIGALWAQLSGQPVPDTPAVTQNDTIAHFPHAWRANPKSDFLRSSYHDVPWEEPDLLLELLQLPWPDRSILARVSDRLRNMTFEQRAARGRVFTAAAAAAESRPKHDPKAQI
jgi:ATP-grasp domain